MKIQPNNEYEIYINHEKEGCGISEREVEDFKEEEPFLRKSLIMAIRNNMKPLKGEWIYGYDNLYYIKQICFYPNHVVYYVSEDEKKFKM